MFKLPTFDRPFKCIKDKDVKEIEGVCAGIAYATKTDVDMIRLCMLSLILFFTPLTALLIYCGAAILMSNWDELPEDYKERTK